MYQVYENEKPAVLSNPCWANNRFASMDEAIEYCKDWLGIYWSDAYSEPLRMGKKAYFYSDECYLQVIKD